MLNNYPSFKSEKSFTSELQCDMLADPDTDAAWFHIEHPAVLLSVSVSPLFPLVSSWEETRGKQIQDGRDK